MFLVTPSVLTCTVVGNRTVDATVLLHTMRTCSEVAGLEHANTPFDEHKLSFEKHKDSETVRRLRSSNSG
jgi:hypothetical protein